jgi:hypothetical protein
MVKRAHGAAGVPGAPVTVQAICESYLEFMEAHRKTAADSRYRLATRSPAILDAAKTEGDPRLSD